MEGNLRFWAEDAEGEETITPVAGQCEKMLSEKGFSFPGNVLSGWEIAIENGKEWDESWFFSRCSGVGVFAMNRFFICRISTQEKKIELLGKKIPIKSSLQKMCDKQNKVFIENF